MACAELAARSLRTSGAFFSQLVHGGIGTDHGYPALLGFVAAYAVGYQLFLLVWLYYITRSEEDKLTPKHATEQSALLPHGREKG